jgi:hypothetical protein
MFTVKDCTCSPRGPARSWTSAAGSGRDAAALAGLGHLVVAAEPTAELRSLGRRIHAGQDIEWVDDSLPEMTVLRSSDQRFDMILLTAVWMHLDAPQRSLAMEGLAGLLAPGERVVFSLRHGPVPAGRRMFDVSAHETVELARGHGLGVRGRANRRGGVACRWTAPGGVVVGRRRSASPPSALPGSPRTPPLPPPHLLARPLMHLSEREDLHGRQGVRWSYLGLRQQSAAP